MRRSKLFASIAKEILLLIRDRAGMALLFVMPAFLVIVVTLIQDKVTTTSVEVLFIDNDQGAIGREVRALLGDVSTLRLVEQLGKEKLGEKEARALVAAGKYQFTIILPAALSRSAEDAAQKIAVRQLFPERVVDDGLQVPEILIWFDPTVHGSFRAAVRSALDQVVRGIQSQLIVARSLELLPEKIGEQFPAAGLSSKEQALSARELMPQLFDGTNLFPVREKFATEMGFIRQPTAVQQNVPAWSIFGIFFIVVPLAGSLIQERESGTLLRLRTLPVSYFTIIVGKIVAYSLVCIAQFMVILAAGIHVLPLFGLPAFDPGSQLVLFGLLFLSIVAAAGGYGIFLGTVGRTYSQVAVLAPISIVIGAAVGGIMVPIYALPDYFRPICKFSPLYWGQSGFYDLLLREGGFSAILPEMAALFGFFFVATLGAYLFSFIKR